MIKNHPWRLSDLEDTLARLELALDSLSKAADCIEDAHRRLKSIGGLDTDRLAKATDGVQIPLSLFQDLVADNLPVLQREIEARHEVLAGAERAMDEVAV